MKNLFKLLVMLFLCEISIAQTTVNAKFIIVETTDQDENPISEIFVQLNDKRIKIESINGNAMIAEKGDFYEGVPSTAISACGAWWAGAGDYFYMVPFANGVKLFKGWQDEGQEDTGYHWKFLQEIKP
jgi:hypothetical protein